MPASLRCASVMGVGAPVSGSKPAPVFGKAMTSRIESTPASSAESRSHPSAAPATVTAEIRGHGLFIRVLVDEDLPASERELLGELARAQVVRLLREGTGGGGWTWDAPAGQWTAVVRLPEVGLLVPDHVPEEWTRAA